MIRETRAKQAQRVKPEPKENRVCRVSPVLKANGANKVPKEKQAHRVRRANEANKVRRACRARKAKRVHRANRVCRAYRAFPARMGQSL